MHIQPYLTDNNDAPNLVMIPGWAMNSTIWGQALDLLKPWFNLYCIDLPGLGKANQAVWPDDPWQMVGQIHAQVPSESIWMGWSMGGLLAQQAVLEKLASRLIMVASSPCIVAKPHWPLGIPTELFEQFLIDLETDYLATLNRFLLLEVHGSEQATQHLKRLKNTVFAHGNPTRKALLGGMSLLASADFSGQLEQLDLPTLLIGGRRDKLIPWAAMEHTTTQLPSAELVRIPGAGHAPFVGNPQLFAETVRNFCYA